MQRYVAEHGLEIAAECENVEKSGWSNIEKCTDYQCLFAELGELKRKCIGRQLMYNMKLRFAAERAVYRIVSARSEVRN